MSNDFSNQNKWERWYPEKVQNFLKLNAMNNKETQYKSDQLYNIAYEEGFKKGLEEGYNLQFKKEELNIQNKQNKLYNNMQDILSNFENQINLLLDDKIINKLLEISLQVSSKVLNTVVYDVNKLSVLSVIKKMIKKKFLLKNIKLQINPIDKNIVREYFSELLKSYNYVILYDKNIEKGGCRIEFQDEELDCTAMTKWKELCRLFCFKGNYL